MTRAETYVPREVQAALPLDVLADTADIDSSTGRVWTRPDDAVTDRALRDGSRVVAGWGESAWRGTLRVIEPSESPDSSESNRVTWSIEPQTSIEPKSLDTRLREWHVLARTAMAELLPNAIDAATRSELLDRILDRPKADVRAQESALQRLAAAHRTLRWTSRRVTLATVAAVHLGIDITPSTSPAWLFLARLSRIPRVRLERGARAHTVYRHDVQPLCPTARALQRRATPS